MKIVINTRHGGFGLSHAAAMLYLERKGLRCWLGEKDSLLRYTYWLVPPEERVEVPSGKAWYALPEEERIRLNTAYAKQVFYPRDVERNDPVLVQIVEELGEKADGRFASLSVVDIPDDVQWRIEEYDGSEWVAEDHRTWR
jgi:hypothetical protein